MSPILSSSEILDRARIAREIASSCHLCPRGCGVNRNVGDRGYCRGAPSPSVAAALPHFGEEPPLTEKGGAGTIFFTRCNLRCVYCQNHQISQGQVLGNVVTPEELAQTMLYLQAQGCASIEPVSPSHHLPGLLEALGIAIAGGLHLPVVYNTNGYETSGTLDLLDGIVDVYLPDLKYAADNHASRYSDVGDYVQVARSAILKMHAQVGNLVVNLNGTAVRGLILRHLVLPGNLSGTTETLFWIKENFPPTVTISLMAQYVPLHRSREFPELNQAVTAEEYERAVDLAWDLGLENVFVQDLASGEVGVPNFGIALPFDWGR